MRSHGVQLPKLYEARTAALHVAELEVGIGEDTGAVEAAPLRRGEERPDVLGRGVAAGVGSEVAAVAAAPVGRADRDRLGDARGDAKRSGARLAVEAGGAGTRFDIEVAAVS